MMKANFDATLMASGAMAPGATRTSPAPQAFDQLFLGFSESLAAASKAGSQADHANDNGSQSGRQQGSSSGDETEAGAAINSAAGLSSPVSQKPAPSQQALTASSAQLTIPILTSAHSVPAEADTAARELVLGNGPTTLAAAASNLPGTQSFVSNSAAGPTDRLPHVDPSSQPAPVSLRSGSQKPAVTVPSSSNRAEFESDDATADGSNPTEVLNTNTTLNSSLAGIEGSLPETAVSTLRWNVSGNSASFQWNAPQRGNLVQGTVQVSVSNSVPGMESTDVSNAHGSRVIRASSTGAANDSKNAAAKSSSEAIPNAVNTAATAVAPTPMTGAVTNAVPQVPFNFDSLSSLPIHNKAGENGAVPSTPSAATSDSVLQPTAPDVAQRFVPSATLAPLASGVVSTSSTPAPSQFWNDAARASTATTWNAVRNADANTPQNPIANAPSNASVAPSSTLSQGPVRWTPAIIQQGDAGSYQQSSAAKDGSAQDRASDVAINFVAMKPLNSFSNLAESVPSQTPSNESENAANGAAAQVTTSAISASSDFPSSMLRNQRAPLTDASVSIQPETEASLPTATSTTESTLAAASIPAPAVRAGLAEAFGSLQAATTIQSAVENTNADPIRRMVSGTAQDSLRNGIRSAVSDVVAKESDDGAANTNAGTTSNRVSQALPDAVPVSVLRSALNVGARGEAASILSTPAVLSTGSVAHPTPLPVRPALSTSSTSSSVPAGNTEKQAERMAPGIGSLPVGQAFASSVYSSPVSKPPATAVSSDKGTSNDSADFKEHAQSSSAQTGSQPSGQGAGAAADQSQSSTASQVQSAAPIQAGIANVSAHTISDVQRTDISAPMTAAPSVVGGTSQAAKTAPSAAPAAPAASTAPQALPVINSARLIQSMGQSEMRVGMRSNEFGNISISTSATRDLVSAQISLDHGELAKALAVHLPEMQAKLGSYQAMDVRIDMNGAASGQGSGTYSSTSNNSTDDSRGERQQPAGNGSSSSVSTIDQRQFSPAATTGIGQGSSSSRLDITV